MVGPRNHHLAVFSWMSDAAAVAPAGSPCRLTKYHPAHYSDWLDRQAASLYLPLLFTIMVQQRHDCCLLCVTYGLMVLHNKEKIERLSRHIYIKVFFNTQ